jgi:hypothetical protein
MGNPFSKAAAEESPEQRQKRLQETYGVLIPPSFIVGGGASLHDENMHGMPISCQAQLRNNASSPSFLEYLWKTNPGHRLLEEYTTPGIYLSVPTSSNGKFLVALNTTTISDASASSFLWAGQGYPPLFKFEFLVPTVEQPSLQVSYCQPGNQTALSAKLVVPSNNNNSSNNTSTTNNNDDEDGYSWIQGNYKFRTASGIDCLFGSWLSLDSLSLLRMSSAAADNGLLPITKRRNTNTANQKYSTNHPSFIHFQAAAEYNQSLIVAQANVPIQRQLQHQTARTNNTTVSSPFASVSPIMISTMISINVNDPTTTSSSSSSSHQPPLWLTLKQDAPSNTLTLNLSQILTFDRPVWNVLEDRAPLVRQTLGWVVQVEKDGNHTTTKNHHHHVSSSSSSCWSVGATWQWNRVLVCDANNNTMRRQLKYGAILKRWSQPRVTLSVLNMLDLDSANTTFLGFGIELETTIPIHSSSSSTTTTSTSEQPYADESTDYVQDDNDAPPPPPTKIQLKRKKITKPPKR